MANANPFDGSQNQNPAQNQNSAPQNMQNMQNLAPKKSKTGLIIGLSVGGGVLVIAAIIILLAVLLGGGVSKKDYNDALTISNKIPDACNDVVNTNISTYTDADELAGDISDIKTSREKCDAVFEDLKDTKAISKDEEAKKLYDSLLAERAKVYKYSDTAVEFGEKIAPLSASIKDVSSSASSDYNATLQKMKDLSTKLKALDLKYQANKDLQTSLSAALDEFTAATEKYVADKTANPNGYVSTSPMYSALTKISSASSKFSTALLDLDDDEFTTKYYDLGNYLQDGSVGKTAE